MQVRHYVLGAALLAQLLPCTLQAQTSAVPFYLRAGYRSQGPEFQEAGIPHQEMRIVL